MGRVGMVLDLVAEFVMGRVCQGPSLSWAEFVMGRDVPESYSRIHLCISSHHLKAAPTFYTEDSLQTVAFLTHFLFISMTMSSVCFYEPVSS